MWPVLKVYFCYYVPATGQHSAKMSNKRKVFPFVAIALDIAKFFKIAAS